MFEFPAEAAPPQPTMPNPLRLDAMSKVPWSKVAPTYKHPVKGTQFPAPAKANPMIAAADAAVRAEQYVIRTGKHPKHVEDTRISTWFPHGAKPAPTPKIPRNPLTLDEQYRRTMESFSAAADSKEQELSAHAQRIGEAVCGALGSGGMILHATPPQQPPTPPTTCARHECIECIWHAFVTMDRIPDEHGAPEADPR
jgi:hypothetical protein